VVDRGEGEFVYQNPFWSYSWQQSTTESREHSGHR
jgi:hypothetical protein